MTDNDDFQFFSIPLEPVNDDVEIPATLDSSINYTRGLMSAFGAALHMNLIEIRVAQERAEKVLRVALTLQKSGLPEELAVEMLARYLESDS